MLVDHLNTSKSEREDSKSLHSFLISYHARLKKLHEGLDIFEKEDSTTIERQKKIIWEELSEILTSGIPYLLLAEIILQESPKSITSYLASGKHNKEITVKALLLWLSKRDIVPIRSDTMKSVTEQDLIRNPLIMSVHEELIESLMDKHLQSSLAVGDIMEAVTAITEGYSLESVKNVHFDNQQSLGTMDVLERGILTWLNQISYAHQTFTDPSKSSAVYTYWRDVCDGVAVVKAIVSYRPELIALHKEIFEKSYLDTQQRLHNWQVIIRYCSKYLGVVPSFSPQSLADLRIPTIRTNLLVFLCDLFCSLVYDEEEETEEDVHEDNIEQPAEYVRLETSVNDALGKTLKSANKLRESFQIIRQSIADYNPIRTPEKEASPREMIYTIETPPTPPTNEPDHYHDEEDEEEIPEEITRPQTPPLHRDAFFKNREGNDHERPSTGDKEDEDEEKIADFYSPTNHTSSPKSSFLEESDDEVEQEQEQIPRQVYERPSTSVGQVPTIVNLDYKEKYEDVVSENQQLREFIEQQQQLFDKERQAMRQEFEMERERIEEEAVRHYIEKQQHVQQHQQHTQQPIVYNQQQQQPVNAAPVYPSQQQPRHVTFEPVVHTVNVEEEPEVITLYNDEDFVDDGYDDEEEEEEDIIPSPEHNQNVKPQENERKGQLMQFAPIEDLDSTSEMRKDQQKRVQKLDQLRKQKMQEEAERKLRQQPQKSKIATRNNKPLVKNALKFVCLQGSVNEVKKRHVLEVLAHHKGEHFVIQLLDDKNSTFKGLYCYENNVLTKLVGEGPQTLSFDLVALYLRYESASKQFNILPTKEFLLTTDAVVLVPNLNKRKNSNIKMR